MENLWIIDNEKENKVDALIDFINEQSALLNSSTEGKVICSIEEDEDLSWLGTVKKHNLNDILYGEKNGNVDDFYKQKRFVVKIKDKSEFYFLSLFRFSYLDDFPISITIDSDIEEEAFGGACVNEVQNLDEFISIFKKIIQSKKTRFIIRKFMSL